MAQFREAYKRLSVWLLRKIALLEFSDNIRMQLVRLRSRASKKHFQTTRPGVSLPPEDILYDAAGGLHWEGYWQSGLDTARYMSQIIKSHLSGGKVLEWGCGPARIIRHLPEALGPAFEVIGSDYNRRSIAWCTEHIRGVRFLENELMPPLAVADQSVACVYAVSVFTHLSAEAHEAWIRHLFQVLQPGGLLIISTHGDATRDRLSPIEAKAYDMGNLVVRGKVLEGSRMYLAYHSPQFVRQELLREFEILGYDRSPVPILYLQDLWIARKPGSATAQNR